MKLLLDAGNTRIKWALISGTEWLQSGAMATDQTPEIVRSVEALSQVRQVWASNVAGESVAAQIRNIGVPDTRFITAQASGYGVKNSYDDPGRLGSDRWLAMIAARSYEGGKCLVVNSGTATTIDALTEQGVFIGGLILPGIVQMQKTLRDVTSGLNAGSGKKVDFPRNTADALYSGAVQATCGAITLQKTLMGIEDTRVILSGGAADQLLLHLGKETLHVENLVLRGIEIVAREAQST